MFCLTARAFGSVGFVGRSRQSVLILSYTNKTDNANNMPIGVPIDKVPVMQGGGTMCGSQYQLLSESQSESQPESQPESQVSSLVILEQEVASITLRSRLYGIGMKSAKYVIMSVGIGVGIFVLAPVTYMFLLCVVMIVLLFLDEGIEPLYSFWRQLWNEMKSVLDK